MRFLSNMLGARHSTWFDRGWLAVVYLVGILLWGQFLDWGRIQFNYHDWADITGPRLTFLKDALTRGELPLHISATSALNGTTDRFLAVPDEILSPQIVLLRFLSIGGFILANTWLLYSAGFLGLLWFRHHFGLSFVPFLALFALFNFNGHILAHLAVGHATWGGYFLFPWFAALVFTISERKVGWVWIASMSGLLFVTWIQGSFHQYVWELLFLAFLALARRAYSRASITAGLFGVLLSLVRIVPAALVVEGFNTEYYGGYQSLDQLWQSLVTVYAPGTRSGSALMPVSLGNWEFTLFLGIVGAIFLLYFGVWRWLMPHPEGHAYHSLLLPVASLTVLSIGWTYAFVRVLPIPLLDGERVTSRIMSLPFVFLLILAVVEFQRWLSQGTREGWIVSIVESGAIVVGGHDLWQNYRVWEVVNSSSAFTTKEFDQQAWFVANHPDLKYAAALAIGAALSCATLTVLAFFVFKSRREQTKFPPERR